MKLKKWKEINHKEKGIILFTILSILLIVGVFFYQSFAIFKANTNQDLIEGNVENMGDLEFAFYINGELSPTAPKKGSEYSFDSSSSKCIDVKTGNQLSHIVWNDTRWSAEIKDITNTKTKCFLNFKQIYKEEILNGAIPDLGNGRLIPIKISEDTLPSDVKYTNSTNTYGGKVTKADITDEWYKYSEQKWANAVILKDESITYQDNEEIPESNIESYFVWIPRYRYQIWNDIKDTTGYNTVQGLGAITDVTTDERINQNKAIEIKFENKNEPLSKGNTEGNWLTHPAFVSFNTNGLWVGKFETGYNQGTDMKEPITTGNWTKSGALKDENQSNRIVIKPNVYSWRGINVSNAFYTSYNYERLLESHMMKNMEWGAVAYLTYSKYGRCNGSCQRVRINNGASYVTGYGATEEPKVGNNLYHNYQDVTLGQDGNYGYNYYNFNSKEASTTGNYSGIYDMSGGAWEYMMAVMVDESNRPISGRNNDSHSNFIGPLGDPGSGSNPQKSEWTREDGGFDWPDFHYYDTYSFATTDQMYQRGIFGDGTKEFGKFYSFSFNSQVFVANSWHGGSSFFKNTHPYLVRGGEYLTATFADISAFAAASGAMQNNSSFRVVLSF